MLGVLPSGIPAFSPLNVKTVLPAVALGRGVTRRGRIELSSGKTWYFAASVRNNACISFNLSGFLPARSLFCEKFSVRLYSSHLESLTSGSLAVPRIHGGTGGVVLAYQPLL